MHDRVGVGLTPPLQNLPILHKNQLITEMSEEEQEEYFTGLIRWVLMKENGWVC